MYINQSGRDPFRRVLEADPKQLQREQREMISTRNGPAHVRQRVTDEFTDTPEALSEAIAALWIRLVSM